MNFNKHLRTIKYTIKWKLKGKKSSKPDEGFAPSDINRLLSSYKIVSQNICILKNNVLNILTMESQWIRQTISTTKAIKTSIK